MKKALDIIQVVPSFEKKMQVGLGEAIKRTNLLHSKLRSGIANSEEIAEHELLMEALNEIKIDLGFDCDGDGIPDTIEVFAKTAKTSCCRLVPSEGFSPAPKRKRKTSSRSKPKTRTRKK